MNRLSCRSYLRLLAQRRAGLTDAERFRLESHLQECDTCAGDARDLDALVWLSESEALPALSPARRERALRSALAPRPTHSRAASETPWLRRLLVPVAIASAAAAGIALSLRGGGDEPDGDGDRRAQVEDIDGDRADETTAPDPAETPPPAPAPPVLAENEHVIASGDGITLGRASITAVREAELVWRADDERVDLARGAIRVKVEPDPARTFTVSTGAFSVVVLGTEFEVDESRVRVVDGAVRIIASDGTVLAEVTSGETWDFGDEPKADAETTAAAEPAPRVVPAARSLALARRHIAAGEAGAARKALVRALAGNPSRREMAEAHTLLAELAVVRGDRAEAAKRYELVADRFRGLVAAENALFAAARLRLQAGETEAAEALLRRYLRQYPSGRFHAEVQRNLERLAP